MSLFTEDLGCCVTVGAANIGQELIVGLEVLRNAKVDEDDVCVLGVGAVEDILWLDVSVNLCGRNEEVSEMEKKKRGR